MMRFLFEGGDGDRAYFDNSFVAELVKESWFPSEIPRGKAYLAHILTGAHKGEYLALTSRVEASLEEQLSVRDYLSVVVHSVRNPGAGFVAEDENLPAIGMAAVKVIRPRESVLFKNPW